MDNGYVSKDDLKTALQTAVQEIKLYVDKRAEEIEGYVDKRTYDAETRLLTAFSDYNSASNVRFRKIEADVSNSDTSSTQRLGELERRVADLEIRILKQEERPPR